MAATFSYAQAAKGIAPAPSSAKADPTQETSKIEEQNADSSSQTNTETVSSKVETAQEGEVIEAADKEVDHTTNAKVSASGTSSPSDGSSSTSTIPKDDEESNTPNGTSESTWDKQSQVSGTEKATNAGEDAKDKTTEKEKTVPAKELKVAPLPTVNIWHQRKEAQEAKAKAIAALKPTAKSGTSKTTSAASSISGDHQPEPSKPAPKKKGSDNTEGPKDRKKTDGGKGREDSASIPPVGDASMWPTPQVAQGEDKKKTQEKTEKSDKSPVIRPHGKEKWTPVPYVPTAVFNTPLPSARRGGRTARGGRENTRNGPHGTGADKTASGQAVQAKQAASADRGRNEQNSGRANSLPAQTRRSNSADAGLPDTRKHQTADRGRGSKGAENANAGSTGRNSNGAETFPRHHRDAKQFAKGHDAGHKGGEHGSRNPQMSVDARSGTTQDRRLENGPKSADFAGFHDRKEKEFTRESRADRGRGSHRGGRGGFSGAPNSHFPNNHISHHNYVHPKTYGFTERQRSQHGPVNGSQGHRMNIRSPSLPNSAAMYGAYPFPGDMNAMYGYQPMHAGPMTAYPYPQYMEPFSLMSMISMQLEYYFSVDNLCKDMFLRKHMDSQGYVGLAFIASFKRIKTLTEDIELLRHVSRQLRNVEYFASENGLDRLRPREHWGQWVLPLDQRDLSAQNEGPSPASNIAHLDETVVSQNHLDGAVNGQLPNGTAESHGPKTSLSSAAPEFSPSNPLNAQTEVTN